MEINENQARARGQIVPSRRFSKSRLAEWQKHSSSGSHKFKPMGQATGFWVDEKLWEREIRRRAED